MTNLAVKPATYADIEALPPHMVGEIIHGTLVTHPRPVRRHAGAASALGAILMGPFQFGQGGPGGWLFAHEPELHLGPHVVVPDIAGWRVENMTECEDQPYFSIPPDWVFEALSPSTEKYDLGPKRDIYHAFGVGYRWYLDPRIRTLETYTRTEKFWDRTGVFVNAAPVCAPPFDAITFSLGLLWPFARRPEGA
jgi:hypothetical protein